MKVIVVGLGQKGILAADQIAKDGHDVLVVDISQERVDTVTNKYNVSGMCGSGVSRTVLMRAGADTADVVIAVTPEDEENLMTCQMAKKCGTRYTVASVNQPELYEDREYFKKELGVDYIVNPKLDTAWEIARDIGLPGAVSAEAFFHGATTISLRLPEHSPLVNMAMTGIRAFFGAELLVGAVIRDEKLYIPSGDFVLQAEDIISIFAPNTSLNQIMLKLGLIRKPVKNVFIIGGGTIAYYLAKELLAEKRSVTILEAEQSRCAWLMENLPEAQIACAVSEDADVLRQEGIASADVCVALTGRDDTNMVISMFAWSLGMNSIITKVDAASYVKLMAKVNMNITVSPSSIAAERILRFVRDVSVYNAKGNDIKRMYDVANGLAEAYEFIAYDNFKKVNIVFKSQEFKLKKGVMIAALIRKGKVIIPDGNSSIAVGDHVVVIAEKQHIFYTINEIFA